MQAKAEDADVLIVGCGVAGLYAALSLPRSMRITMLSKGALEQCDSMLAQGGICVLPGEDDYAAFFEDTLRAGHYENRRESVEVMIRSSRAVIDDLLACGVSFEREESGALSYTREGAHTRPRICYHADTTGREITTKLLAAVRALPNVRIFEHVAMVDLVVEDGACAGVMARRVSAGESHLTAEELRAGAPDRGEGGPAGLDAGVGRGARARASVSGAEPVSGAAPGSAAAQVAASASVLAPSSAAPVAASAPAPASATTHASAPVSVPVAAAPVAAPFPLRASVTILATGGIGGLYDRSTNYPQLTGDACLIAAEHGIALEHLDYVQIHPTGLYTKAPGRVFLISESCRGEGAVLLNRAGERFTDELAPRDVVAAAIREQMRRDGSPFVRLSFAPVDPDVIKGHFGTIRARCLEELGLDILTDPIPVVPTQHYFMGGIAVDVDGASSVPGLYAVGETACNGVHGRNRLASNSLLEALVWAGRAAGRIATGASLAVGALPGVGGFGAADADAGGAAGGFGVAGAGADGALGGGLPSAMSTQPEPAASAPDPAAPARWAPGLGDIAQPSPAADEPARPTTSAAMRSLVVPARPTAKETA